MTAESTRARAIEAGARAMQTCQRSEHWATYAAAVVDAVTPIIRADEREATWRDGDDRLWAATAHEAEVRERLRAQVEDAMPTAREDFGGPYTALEWVLDLLDGPR